MTLGKRLRTSDKFIHLSVVQRGEMASAPGSSEDKSLRNVTEMILSSFLLFIFSALHELMVMPLVLLWILCVF